MCEWGAYGDNNHDDTVAVNSAITWGLQLSQTNKNYIPDIELEGAYKVSSPVNIFLQYPGGTSYYYISASIHGPKSPGYITRQQVGFFATTALLNQPVVIIQGARFVNLSGFTVMGVANNGAGPTLAQLSTSATGASWANINGARDSQYSPHAGIAVDPFSAAIPSDGGYPGLSAYYVSGRTSSLIHMDNMNITRCVVGVMLTPNPTNQNDDNVLIKNSLFFLNQVHVAVGQSQSRGVELDSDYFQYANRNIDTLNYGAGQGDFPTVRGGVSIYAKYMFAASAYGTNSGGISDFYAESIYSLGAWVGSGAPLHISNSRFKFVPPASGLAPAADYILYNTSPVNIVGGLMIFYDNTPWRLSFAPAAALSIDGTVLSDVPYIITNGQAYATFRNVKLYYKNGGNRYGLSSLFNEALATIGTSGVDAYLSPGGMLNDPGGVAFNGQSMPYRYMVNNSWQAYNYETVTITVNGGGTATFTSANAANYAVYDSFHTSTAWSINSTLDPSHANFAAAGLFIGRVKTIVGSTVTIEGVPQSLTSGSYYIAASRLGAIKQRITGTFTSGSPTVTLSAASIFKAGDFINTNGCTANNTRAASVSGTTLTLSANATASGTCEVYDALLTLSEGYTSAAVGFPTTRYFRRGEILKLINGPALDANNNLQTGYVTTVSGNPATGAPLFMKTTSP